MRGQSELLITPWLVPGVQQTGRACAALVAVNKESSSGDFLTSLSGFEVPVDS